MEREFDSLRLGELLEPFGLYKTKEVDIQAPELSIAYGVVGWVGAAATGGLRSREWGAQMQYPGWEMEKLRSGI